MPRFNRTGPEGQGSQTGRKMGKCNPNNQESNEQLDVKESPGGSGRRIGLRMRKGFGLGKGTGRGMGRRNGRSDT